MNVTFDQLITRTGYFLNLADAIGGFAGPMTGYSGATDEGKFWVNMAYRKISRKFRLLTGKPIAVTEKLFSWIANQEAYDLPDDFGYLQSIEGGWEAGRTAGERYPIEKVEYENRTNYYAQTEGYIFTSAGLLVPKRQYYIYSPSRSVIEKIGFVPIPTESLTENVKMFYWPFADRLTASDSIIIHQLEEWDELIACEAAIIILEKARLDPGTLVAIRAELMSDFEDTVRNKTPNENDSPDFTGYYQ